MITYNSSTKIGRAFGRFFGFINEKINPHFHFAGKKIDKKVDEISR